MATELVVLSKQSTSKTAHDLHIPLKALEKWITSYHKDNHIFDSDYVSPAQQIATLKKRIAELEKTNDILKRTLEYCNKENH